MTKVTLEQLLAAGCHFGHQSRRWNPTMAKYIYTTRDNVHIFDLAQTLDGLNKGVEFLKGIKAQGGQILFVGTKRQAKAIVKQTAIDLHSPYVVERWLGGMLTNFGQVQKSVRKLRDLTAQRTSGELKKYTKYEQLQIDREIDRLNHLFGGLLEMEKLPAALFVVDTHQEEVAVREARRMGIPVVGMVDTNAEPELVDYVIPTNDDAVAAIELIVNTVKEELS